MGSPQRVLIANRGEIAVRVARAAAGLGIESVAVHASVDADSLHVGMATTAHLLPGEDPVAAYLDVGAVVAAAVATGCGLLHPGYGFLAENPDLARRCADAGISFIGPSVEALELFGDKIRARAAAVGLGIPVVPGSDRAVTDVAGAAELAAAIGYPVMVKAAAGGGGRGLRAVTGPEELAGALDRCRGEAEAAFGDGRLFLERLVADPRHVEVQVLGDSTGAVVHLHDRDCSVQRRNQKVIEIAPAPGLGSDLRERLHRDALALAAASRLVNAATIEFLVDPGTGAHWFIECNPRIQVEHTVTEEVTGIDLVETQFHLAAGRSLASLGLADATAIGRPRGFAVQARISATGPGTLAAYREPSGPGVRVDAAGYPGYTPPTCFDPLLAKVIGSGSTLIAALGRTALALDELHLVGLATDRDEVAALLRRPEVSAGDARTTLTASVAVPGPDGPGAAGSTADPSPEGPTSPGPEANRVLALLDRHAPGAAGSTDAPGVAVNGPGRWATVATVEVAEGCEAVAVPVTSVVASVEVAIGDRVAPGDTMLVLSAMKMETVVTAPCAGVVRGLADLAPGDPVAAGQVVAAVEPGDTGPGPSPVGADPWRATLDDVATLRRLALERLAPGSTEPGVVRQRDRGKLTCRERIDALLDAGSFNEIGSVAGFASHDGDGAISAFTPANHVGGWGTVEQRQVVVCADDFTSRGGHADGAIGAKSLHLDRLAVELRIPSIRLLDGSSGGGSVAAMVPAQRSDGESRARESSGAIAPGRPRVAGGGGSFLPGHLGATTYADQLATVPVVNLLLGSVVGIGAAKAVLGHFSVMVRDLAQLFVAGPPVVSHAMGYDISREDLGGWHLHCRNGAVDNLAETEEEAFDQARRFLSYLPSSVDEAPPLASLPSGDRVDRREDELARIIPRSRTTTFDIRRVVGLLADRDSFFEIGGLWGTDQVTGLIRVDGHPMGVIASDSRHLNGGALTAAGCEKLTRHLDLCDLFHLPVLNLVDNPGFAVGVDHEAAATIRRGGTWMVAFAQVEVPIFTVLLRRSFGVAGNHYATPRAQPAMRVVWPSADVGGIPPEGGIEAAYKRQLAEADDPAALRAELEARIESVRGPLGPLSRFEMEEMIDPRDTRGLIARWLPLARRLVSSPGRLGPRPLRFRP